MGLLSMTILLILKNCSNLEETKSQWFSKNDDELLNPSLKCGFQVQEILLQHTDLSTSETKGDTFAIRESKTAWSRNSIR
jgi:peptide/nickel transport system ATP-binding protein